MGEEAQAEQQNVVPIDEARKALVPKLEQLGELDKLRMQMLSEKQQKQQAQLQALQLQAQTVQAQFQHTQKELQELGMRIREQYQLDDYDQLDLESGRIIRTEKPAQ